MAIERAVRLLSSADAFLADVPNGSIVVVCDQEGAVAADLAELISSEHGSRTAVFVGSLSDLQEKAAAIELCTEIFGFSPELGE